MVNRIALSLLAIFLSQQPVQSQVGIDEWLALYRQTLASGPPLRVSAKVTVESSKEYRDHCLARIEFIKESWNSLTSAEKQKNDSAYKAILASYTEKARSPNPAIEYLERISIEQSPQGMEVTRFLTKEKSEAEKSAERRGIKSATGGRFAIYRWDSTSQSQRWIAIEPFPYPETKETTYTEMVGKLKVMLPLIPPFFNADGKFETMFADPESSLFATPKVGDGHRAYSLSETEARSFLSLNLNPYRLVAGAVSLGRKGLPDWMARFSDNSAKLKSLDTKRARELDQSMRNYRTQSKFEVADQVFPEQAVWLENWAKLDGGLEYPKTAILRFFEPTKSNDKLPRDLVFLVAEYKLEVESIDVLPPDKERTYATKIPDGARVVDFAAGTTKIVGKDENSNLENMLAKESRPMDWSRPLLIILNLAGAALLVSLVLIRHRRRKSASRTER